jgi:hypothetical protein
VNDDLEMGESTVYAPEEKKKPSNTWIGRIESAGREELTWRNKASMYWRRYLNRHGLSGSATDMRHMRSRSNILFSNVEFFRAAVLPQMPQPVIRERYAKQQADDDTQKQFYAVCADIVEKAIEYAVKSLDNKKAVERFKNDALITGRGVLWVVFNADDDGQGGLTNERLELKHLAFNDFRMSPARNWEEAWWVARRILLDKSGVKGRFGPEIAEKLTFTYPTANDEQWKGDNTVQYESRAEIWEVWDKKSKKVVFVSPGYPDVLEENPDPYKLTNFFPTPEPLRLISDPNTMIPNPEFDIYRQEADDLAECAERKSALLHSIRARCFVPMTYMEDVSKLNSAGDSEYVPIDANSAVLQSDGGVASIFQYEPIEERSNVIQALNTEMEALTGAIYDITGRSDAMTESGATPGEGGDAETATRTIMKGKFGSLRLQKKQELFNDYINEIYKVCSELICEMYGEQTLAEITAVSLPTDEEKQQDAVNKQQKEAERQQQEQQAQMQAQQQQQQGDPNDPNAQQQQQPEQSAPPEEPLDIRYENYIKKPTWPQVKEFLKNTRLAAYLLDVETEMNVWEADSETQQARVSLFDTFIEKIGAITPIIQEHPEFAGVLMSLLGFVLDSFKMPASQRNQMDDAMQAVEMDLKQSAAAAKANPAPQADVITAQAEQTKAQAEMMNAQTKQQEVQTNSQLKQQEFQLKGQEIQAKTAKDQMDTQIAQQEFQLKSMEQQNRAQEAEKKFQIEQMKLQATQQKDSGKLEVNKLESDMKAQTAREKMQAQMAADRLKSETKMRIEAEKLQHKAEIERNKLIEKAASADQEFEAKQMEPPEDITLE